MCKLKETQRLFEKIRVIVNSEEDLRQEYEKQKAEIISKDPNRSTQEIECLLKKLELEFREDLEKIEKVKGLLPQVKEKMNQLKKEKQEQRRNGTLNHPVSNQEAENKQEKIAV